MGRKRDTRRRTGIGRAAYRAGFGRGTNRYNDQALNYLRFRPGLSVHGGNGPPDPFPLPPEPQDSALSPRRPVDRPSAELEHHDLPRRRQSPQHVVEDPWRELEVSGDVVPRHSRAGPRDERRQPLGGIGAPVAVPKPFAKRLHEIYTKSGAASCLPVAMSDVEISKLPEGNWRSCRPLGRSC